MWSEKNGIMWEKFPSGGPPPPLWEFPHIIPFFSDHVPNALLCIFGQPGEIDLKVQGRGGDLGGC